MRGAAGRELLRSGRVRCELKRSAYAALPDGNFCAALHAGTLETAKDSLQDKKIKKGVMPFFSVMRYSFRKLRRGLKMPDPVSLRFSFNLLKIIKKAIDDPRQNIL